MRCTTGWPVACANQGNHMQLLLHHSRSIALTVCEVSAVACGVAACVLSSGTAQEKAADVVPMKVQEVQSGTMLFKPKNGGDTLAVPQQSTEVMIRVSGIVARATVKQTFRNP